MIMEKASLFCVYIYIEFDIILIIITNEINSRLRSAVIIYFVK